MSNVPSSASFELDLNHLFQGAAPALQPCKCLFQYQWDFGTNTGQAYLLSINDAYISISLNPLGLAGQLAFMSDTSPTVFGNNGNPVDIYRVVLYIDLDTGERKAGMMFNFNGDVIQTTPNLANDVDIRLTPGYMG